MVNKSVTDLSLNNSFEGFEYPNTDAQQMTPMDTNELPSMFVSSTSLGSRNFDNPVALSAIFQPLANFYSLLNVLYSLSPRTNSSQSPDAITKLCIIVKPISNVDYQLDKNCF